MARPARTQTLEERFWSKVDKTGDCWLWTGARDSSGYGVIGVNKRLVKAHRLSLTMIGIEIKDGKCVCHLCDTPACVRPEHLFVGSHSDNMQDMLAKDRQPAQMRQREMCKKGLHAMTPENVLIWQLRDEPMRICRECRNARRRKHG